MITSQCFNFLLDISAKQRTLGFFYNLNVNHLHRRRCYCKDKSEKSSVKVDKNSKIISNPPSSKKLMKYINTVNPEALQILSTKYLKPCSITKRSISLCLINEATAREFVNLFIDDIKNNSCDVIDANGGLGLVTKELLNAGIPVVHTFAKDLEFQNILQKLQLQYPNRIHIEQGNLFQSIGHSLTSNINGHNKPMDLMQNIQHRQSREDSRMRIIGFTIDRMIMKYLVLYSIFKNSIMSKGRIVFYLGILPSLWNELTYFGKNFSMYRFNNVLFTLLFDSKLLGKLDRYSALPWQRKKPHKHKLIKKPQNDDEQFFYVVRIEPKVFNTGSDENELMLFYFFVRHHMISRKNKIIPELEKWIPDCGPRLIAKNYHVFTQFGDLSPNELWDLFKFFMSWPETQNSNFILSAQTYFQNYDQGLTLNKESANVDSNISNIYIEQE